MLIKKTILTTLVLMLAINLVSISQLNAQFLGAKATTQVELVSEVKSIQPGSRFWVALHMVMQENWHTYWRNPGDSGLKTVINWKLPPGFTASDIHWPVPEKIDTPPLITYGYHGEVFLLTEISAPDDLKSGELVQLNASVEWLECKEICLPGNADVSVEIAVSEDTPLMDERWVQKFSEIRSQLPLPTSEWEISTGKEKGNYVIVAEPPEWFEQDLKRVDFFPYREGIIDLSAKQILQKQGSVYVLSVATNPNAETLPDTLEGILVSDEGWRGPGSEKALEVILPVEEDLVIAAPGTSESGSMALNILFSFLGGIILNLMPCVLPVLSIKIMGFVEQANDTQAKPWQHGLIFTLGVLVSFWVLAGALLILKASGEQLGWGFQLQSPAFLIILSAFMFLFGLSMFGVFEIGTSLTAVGGKSQSGGGWMGSFIGGVTATVVATPCTAPFMGSALGFGLSQPAWVAMTIFTFLGLGMAFPYLLLSSIPSLLKFVPKPGRWMESLKQFMGFLLLATVLWLLWVLSIQSGAMMVIVLLAALLIMGLAGWIYGRWGNLAMPVKTRAVATTIAVLLTAAAIFFPLDSIESYAVTPDASGSNYAGDGIQWQNFSPEYLQEVKQQRKAIFLDFTAAWCLSCQVNERVAFSSEKVQKKFEELDIVAIKADWTSRSETITKALASYGRNSVPLYVYYPAGENDDPVILPEIITPGIVLEALQN